MRVVSDAIRQTALSAKKKNFFRHRQNFVGTSTGETGESSTERKMCDRLEKTDES